MNKVVIVIRSGVLVSVYAEDPEVDIKLFDFDDTEDYAELDEELQVVVDNMLQVYP